MFDERQEGMSRVNDSLFVQRRTDSEPQGWREGRHWARTTIFSRRDIDKCFAKIGSYGTAVPSCKCARTVFVLFFSEVRGVFCGPVALFDVLGQHY